MCMPAPPLTRSAGILSIATSATAPAMTAAPVDPAEVVAMKPREDPGSLAREDRGALLFVLGVVAAPLMVLDAS
jgi:hypothetical protein